MLDRAWQVIRWIVGGGQRLVPQRQQAVHLVAPYLAVLVRLCTFLCHHPSCWTIAIAKQCKRLFNLLQKQGELPLQT